MPLRHYPWPLPIWDSGSALLYLETRKKNNSDLSLEDLLGGSAGEI